MDTAGESPVKRVKKAHRGRRSSAGHKKRDQRNEKYYPGAFAFAWLAQNYGTASCSVDPASDGGERSIETERGIVGAGETTAGSPQDSWADAGRAMNRTEASVRDTSQAGGSCAARAQEAPGGDDGRFGFGAFAARYQPENFWRDWSRVFRTWAGRFQRGRVQEIIRSVEARPGDEATVAELDLRLEEWASAELKSVAADFCTNSLLKGKALKIVLTNIEGEGFEAWRALVNKYGPTSKASVVGKLAEILRTPFDGDLLDALTTFERKIMIYEAQSRETISDSLKIGGVIAGMGQNSMKEHLLMSATKCDSWTNFVRKIESIEHARKTITAPTPMELDAFQGYCHKCGEYGHTAKECRSSNHGGAEKRQCAQCGKKHHGQCWARSYTSSHKDSQKGGWKGDRKGNGKGTQKGGKFKGGKGVNHGKEKKS